MENKLNYTRPEELLTKVIEENNTLRDEIKILNEELEEDHKEISKLKSIIRSYQEYFNGKEIPVVESSVEDEHVTYMEWFTNNEEEVDELAQAYAELL